MRRLVLLALAFLCSPCRADEILLKDGRRIAWKSLVDDGDSYSVETKDDQRLKLKKSEVDRFIITREAGPKDVPQGPALTGASFTMDPKKTITVDLIQKASMGGQDAWKVVGGRVLVGTATWPTRAVVTFDYELPEEYDLVVVVERVGKGVKDFDVGIVTGTTQCAFHVDCYDSTVSCLALLAGAEGEHVNQTVFTPNKSRTLRFQIRKEAMAVQLDGKDFWKAKVDWKQASMHPAVQPKEKGKPFLVAAGGDWKVSTFTVTHLK